MAARERNTLRRFIAVGGGLHRRLFGTPESIAEDHIGFTSNIIPDHPFSFARKMSTLDHYTDGRVGWNIVRSYLSNGFRNFGYDDITSHDQRYSWAQEYVDVTFKLWEHSWEDGAVVKNPATGVYCDPDKIHTTDHVGDRYRVQGRSSRVGSRHSPRKAWPPIWNAMPGRATTLRYHCGC